MTNLPDDPGRNWVLVRRDRRRVGMVKDTSKTSISIMWVGTPSGQILPSCVANKVKNTWTGWNSGAVMGPILQIVVRDKSFCRKFFKIFLQLLINL